MAQQDQHELMPAITFMERKVDEAERKAKGLLNALNILRAEAGLPSRPDEGGANPRAMTGLFTSLPTENQRAALAYRGVENLGPAEFLLNPKTP